MEKIRETLERYLPLYAAAEFPGKRSTVTLIEADALIEEGLAEEISAADEVADAIDRMLEGT